MAGSLQPQTASLEWQVVEELVASRIAGGASVQMVVSSASMSPLIQPGDRIEVQAAVERALPLGVILVLRGQPRPWVHRLVKVEQRRGVVHMTTKGDACCGLDAIKAPDQVIGVVVAIERRGRGLSLTTQVMRSLGVRIAWASLHSARIPGTAPTFVRRSLGFTYRLGLKLVIQISWRLLAAAQAH